MIQGISVTLTERTQTGVNEINEPVYEETEVTVENVLVGNPTTDEISDALKLYGKQLAYTLYIPKGDAHNWENAAVTFFGRTFRTFGLPMTLIEDNIPAAVPWNTRIRVEAVMECPL